MITNKWLPDIYDTPGQTTPPQWMREQGLKRVCLSYNKWIEYFDETMNGHNIIPWVSSDGHATLLNDEMKRLCTFMMTWWQRVYQPMTSDYIMNPLMMKSPDPITTTWPEINQSTMVYNPKWQKSVLILRQRTGSMNRWGHGFDSPHVLECRNDVKFYRFFSNCLTH